jgi:hypothetical protein
MHGVEEEPYDPGVAAIVSASQTPMGFARHDG